MVVLDAMQCSQEILSMELRMSGCLGKQDKGMEHRMTITGCLVIMDNVFSLHGFNNGTHNFSGNVFFV